MKSSPYQVERRKESYRKALMLYKQGLNLREVGDAMKKSHEWARSAIQEAVKEEENKGSGDKKLDKN